MSEISKAVGQWIVNNVGWSVVIFLFVLSGFFKITKIEVNPIGWLLGKLGKSLTKDVRGDVADLKKDTAKQFEKIKEDRSKKIDELKEDYDSKITGLRNDLDSFEKATNDSISEIQKGTTSNCRILKKELADLKKSNDMQTIRQIRAHVLDFANSCMNNRRHTKKDFDNIIHENEQYEALIKKYKVKNAVYKEDFAFIMKIYHENQETNGFLGEPKD